MRYFGTALAWQAVAVVALAAETPAASTPPRADDAIATVKREIDALRSGTGAVESGTGALPRLSLPDVRASGPEAAAPVWHVPTISNNAQRGPKGASGLLDALGPAGVGATHSGPLDRKRLSAGGSGATDSLAENNAAGRDTREPTDNPDQTRPRQATARASNPLDLYMAGWMTPRDYALLRPALVPQHENDLGLRDAALGLPGPAFGVSPSTGEPDLSSYLATAAKPNLAPPPRENAYVQALNLEPLPRAPNPAPTSMPAAPAPPPRPTLAAPVATPAPKPPMPDFAKPPADDKYFKPLKRF
jgi:hypothetical protein